MPVRIFFRGLILFRFPSDGTLVAELLSEPAGRGRVPGAMAGQNDHESEIQVITEQKVNQRRPLRIKQGASISINIPGRGRVRRATNFREYVPNIRTLAKMAGLPRLNPRKEQDAEQISQHLRASVTVNRGTLRVKDVVMWDGSGYPLGNGTARDLPMTPAQVKFCGVRHYGHAATECVLEVQDTDKVNISQIANVDQPRQKSRLHKSLPQRGPLKSIQQRNQLAEEGATEIVIDNYEYQRVRPVPWGLDFQWLFARAGYGPTDLGNEANTFADAAIGGDAVYAELLAQDRASLLPATIGRPFPYIVDSRALTTLIALGPLTGTQSRPLCIHGTT
jgi:hypothetical protein